MEPAKFRTYLVAEVGEKVADLMTVAPGSQGERTDLEETSRHDVGKSEADQRKEQRLRAILRAPEVIQDLYREGLIPQTIAAKLGPKSPTPEQAAQVAGARQAVVRLDLLSAEGKPKGRRQAEGGFPRGCGEREPSATAVLVPADGSIICWAGLASLLLRRRGQLHRRGMLPFVPGAICTRSPHCACRHPPAASPQLSPPPL